MTVSAAALPPLYAAWIDQLLGGAIPAETTATCDDCAMLAPGDGGDGAVYFDPRIKCCTYLPALPNYLVGRILDDPDPDAAPGRATVEARLAAGVAVTPLGLGRTPVHGLLYEHGGASAFGRSMTLRCPHYVEEGGRCGVWRHRAAVCATWFCKHDRGAVGMAFWRSLYQLLGLVEAGLSRWCVLEVDPGVEALRALFPAPVPSGPGGSRRDLDAPALDGVADPAAQRRAWGRFHGREAEFFRACAERIAGLDFEAVAERAGPDARIAARLVRDSWARLVDRSTPSTGLRPGPFRLVRIGRAVDRVMSYSTYDPVELPKAVLRILAHFDGRPTAEVLEGIAREENIRVDESLVRKLCDFGVLVSPSP